MNTLPTRLLAQRGILRPPFLTRALSPSSTSIRERCAALRHASTSIAAAPSTARASSRSDQAQAQSTSRPIHHSAPSHHPSPPQKSTPTPTPLSPEEYDTKASQTLESLTDSLESLLERIQDNELSLPSTFSSSAEEWDVEYSSGVLNLRLGKAHGTYVLNKQPPNRQIWLSSPSSGPKRFDYEAEEGVGEGERWVCRREGLPGGKVTLKGLVEGELGMLTGLEVQQLGLRFEADS